MIEPADAAGRLGESLRLSYSLTRILAALLAGRYSTTTAATPQCGRVLVLKLRRKLDGLARIKSQRGFDYAMPEADRQALLARAAALPPPPLTNHLRAIGLNHTLAVIHQTLAAAHEHQWLTEAALLDALSRAKGGRAFKASSLAMLMSLLRQSVARVGLTIERFRFEPRWRYHADCLAAAQTLAHLSPIKKERASPTPPNDGPVWPSHEIGRLAREIATGDAPRRPGAPSPYRGRR